MTQDQAPPNSASVENSNAANPVLARQAKLAVEFARFPSWEDRYKHLIELGKRLKAMPAELHDEKFKVQGCQSQVWLHAELKPDGTIGFQADSDALIVKGLVALLVETFSNSRPQDILAAKPNFIQELGFEGHLSPSRANGLHAMIKQIYYYATAFQALQNMRR